MESVQKKEYDKILRDAKTLLTQGAEQPFRCLDCIITLTYMQTPGAIRVRWILRLFVELPVKEKYKENRLYNNYCSFYVLPHPSVSVYLHNFHKDWTFLWERSRPSEDDSIETWLKQLSSFFLRFCFLILSSPFRREAVAIYYSLQCPGREREKGAWKIQIQLWSSTIGD